MIDKLLLKLRARDAVSEEEAAVLRDLVAEIRQMDAKATYIRAEQRLTTSTLLLDGVMCRYKDLNQGQRQITALHIPGDFVDLHSFTLKRLDHNILALTPCRVAVVPHERLTALSEQHPHLTRLLWLSTNIDAAIHREWELSLGRRTATARLAHILCEFHQRLELVRMTDGHKYRFPLTQLDLAECTGLTPVHVNRMLRDLREQGVVEFRRGLVDIWDMPRLRSIAEFNPAYLNLLVEPR